MTPSVLVLLACSHADPSDLPRSETTARVHEHYRAWYRDADGDGHGDPDVTTRSRTRPEGYLANATDCDDADAAVHPGAADTTNGLDDDCDGLTDEFAIEDASFRMIGDPQSGTWVGWSLDVVDLDADGVSDIVTGAPGGGLGGVYIAYGPASGKMNAADAVLITGLGRNMNLGDDIDGGDANGDAAADLLVTTYGREESRVRGAFLFLGPVTADRTTADADAFVSMDSLYETTGLIVPDATGDGDADLVLGRFAEGPSSYDGRVFVLPGPVTGDAFVETDASHVYEPDTTDGGLGLALVDLGDANGDGVTDFLTSAPYLEPAGGTIYLIAGGGAPGTYSVGDAAYATLTSTPGANYAEITAAGDVDGDGHVDIVAMGEGIVDSAGNAADGPYLHLGPFTGATSTGDATARWVSDTANGNYAGRSLASGGDLDGDEVDDIAIGALNWTDQMWSGVFLQLGPASGTIVIETLPSIMGTLSDNTGSHVSFVPDWDGDGRAEVAVAADSFQPADPSRYVGAIFVVGSTQLD